MVAWPVSAQSELPKVAEAEKRLFSVMAYGDDLFEGILFQDVYQRRSELTFVPDRRSAVYAHPVREGRIHFFREKLDAKGKRIDEVVAEADVGAVNARALLVFLASPAGSTGLPYTVLVADEGPEAFGPGSFRWLNLSGATLAWRVGEENGEIGTAFSKTVSLDPGSREPFAVALAVRAEEEWRFVFSTRMQAAPDAGALLIVKPPPVLGSMRVEVTALRDRPKRERAR